MQIVISCAKDMSSRDEAKNIYGLTDPQLETWVSGTPVFWKEAVEAASELAEWTDEELAGKFKCSDALAALNRIRFGAFGEGERSGLRLQAALTYSGVAFKHLKAGEWSLARQTEAQKQLWIFSFLYGLLRPMDLILPYRMEGNVKLEVHEGKTMFEWWKPRLTALLLDAVRKDDGRLLWCSTEEMKHLVDWKEIVSGLEVVEPEFLVGKQGKGTSAPVLKSMSVYAKMCRGAMARQLTGARGTLEELKAFSYQGFVFREERRERDGHLVLTYVKAE